MDGSPQNHQDQDLRAYGLTNVTRDLQKTLSDQSMYEYSGYCSNLENFVPDSFEDIEYDFDEFVGLKKGLRNSPAIWKFVRKTSMSLSILPCSTVQFAQKKDEFNFFKDE